MTTVYEMLDAPPERVLIARAAIKKVLTAYIDEIDRRMKGFPNLGGPKSPSFNPECIERNMSNWYREQRQIVHSLTTIANLKNWIQENGWQHLELETEDEAVSS